MGVVDVAGVESDVTASQLGGHAGPVEHTSSAGRVSATDWSSRVPRMSCSMRPRLRPGKQTAKLVVHVTGSKDAVSTAARTMCLRRQVSQNAINRRNLTTVRPNMAFID